MWIKKNPGKNHFVGVRWDLNDLSGWEAIFESAIEDLFLFPGGF